METMTLILFLTISVLISAIINQVTPHVTLPLVQIAMGMVIAMFASGAIEVNLDPDMFLVIFIAPLLYIEAKHADKLSLWKDLKPILGLAIVLVVITAIVIGLTLHLIAPFVSIWAALALGAALGPTDAVAVTSLSKTIEMNKRDYGILKGELLLNDASGIVMFQVAIAAVTAGTIDVIGAGTSFLIEFFGGLILGAICGFAGKTILSKARDIGIDSTVFHVLFELCMPFVIYLLSNSFHVSGIIAVVVGGLVNPIQASSVSPAVARMNIVSDSVWDVLSFALNGIVFVLLGTQIPNAMFYVWEDASISNITLLMYILIVTFVLLFIRFVWILITTYMRNRGKAKLSRKDLNNCLVMTFGGAKGTITLSILFTLPYILSTGEIFHIRNLLIFIGCGVILVTLLLATFLLPIIAPKKTITEDTRQERDDFIEGLQEVLRSVIEQLTATESELNRRAVRAVIASYQIRLDDINTKTSSETSGEDLADLRIEACRLEQEFVESWIDENKVSEEVGYAYLDKLNKMERLLTHNMHSSLTRNKFFVIARRNFFKLRHFMQKIIKQGEFHGLEELRRLRINSEKYVVDKLKDKMASEDIEAEKLSRLIIAYEANIASLSKRNPSVTSTIEAGEAIDDVKAYAYELELDKIAELQQNEKISRNVARKMRENVQLMQLELNNAI